MTFSESLFLLQFLPLTLVSLWLAPARFRNTLLLLTSLVFYISGDGAWVAVLIALALINWALALLIGRARYPSDHAVNLAVALAVTINLTALAWFKYATFATQSLNAALTSPLPVPHPHLVLGISFFTFQALSYVIDVARHDVRPERNPLRFLLYLTLYPQLIAGPIVRYAEVAAQLTTRTLTTHAIAEGFLRFSHGLARKVLVADTLATAADHAFALSPAELTTSAAWWGLACYTLQIYFDFSGYSDMAIGLGRMMGFHFPENFAQPYAATSITAFWRRWHLTLSHWFRDYLYIPLGGSRRSPARTTANLVIVFLLCGLWHGASLNFIAWGAWHGLFLAIERPFRRANPNGALTTRTDEHTPLTLTQRAPRIALTLFIVSVGWVFFRADTLTHATNYFAALAALTDPARPAYALIDAEKLIVFALAVTLSLRRFLTAVSARLRWRSGDIRHLEAFVALTLLALSLAVTIARQHSPFIYFRF